MYSATRQRLLEVLGYFWSNLFLDSDFVVDYATSFAVPFSELADEVSRLPDYLSRYTVPITEPGSIRLFLLDESEEDTNAYHYGDDGLVYGGPALYGQENLTGNMRKFPIDAGFEPKYLATSIDSPATILELGVDYTIADGWITFLENPEGLTGLMKRAKLVGDTTYFTFFFWGFQVQQDIEAVNNFFGSMVGVCGASTERTKRAVNVAWDLRVNGATVQSVGRLLSVLTDTDYVETAGTVAEIYPEGDRICVLTENAVYTAPLEAAVLAETGDLLSPGDEIFDTYAVKVGADVIDFDDFEGIALGPEFLPALGAPLLFPNTQQAITKEHRENWFSVRSE